MSIFNDDIIQQNLCTGQVYDIRIVYFSSSIFYKWIWKEKGIEYPPRYSRSLGIPGELLHDIIVNKLGEIPADDFIKWVEEFVKDKSIKHFRRYFKKLIKREYMSNFVVNLKEGNISVCIPCENFFGYVPMTIIFHKK